MIPKTLVIGSFGIISSVHDGEINGKYAQKFFSLHLGGHPAKYHNETDLSDITGIEPFTEQKCPLIGEHCFYAPVLDETRMTSAFDEQGIPAKIV